MENNWVSVKERLPEEQGLFKVKTLATMLETIFHPKYGFDYDMQCEEYSRIVEVGEPDKVTHWQPSPPNQTT